MLVGFLQGGEAAAASRAELAQRVSLDGQEVLRLAFQGHLVLRSKSEQRVEVTDEPGYPEVPRRPGMSGCWPPSSTR